MKILFLGLIYKASDEKELIHYSKNGISVAHNLYQWNVINGLKDITEGNINVINSLPVGNFPKLCNKLVFKSKKWGDSKGDSYNNEIGFINFYVIKHLMREHLFTRHIESWIKMNEEEECFILIYDLYLPLLKAVMKLKKRYKRIHTCVIITDLPGKYGFDEGFRGYKKSIMNIRYNKIYEKLKEFDSYVILTDYMKDVIGIENKPYTTVEGIVKTTEDIKYSDTYNGKKIIMYTGVLSKQYGIGNLLDAFKLIKYSDYELWLCGTGDMEGEIKLLQETDNRVKYFGYIPKSQVLELQTEITAYINPRQNIGVYTKYSFPSKTMEYLASGKPVISYKLDGIPEEYDQFLLYVDNNSINSLSKKIVEVCEMTIEKRTEIGIRGRKFVHDNKNNIAQSNKIISMFEEMISENKNENND